MIAIAEVAASVDERDRLALVRSARVVRIEWLRSVDEKLCVAETIAVPLALFPGLAALELPNTLYSLYAMRFGITVAGAKETLKAIALPEREAALWKSLQRRQFSRSTASRTISKTGPSNGVCRSVSQTTFITCQSYVSSSGFSQSDARANRSIARCRIAPIEENGMRRCELADGRSAAVERQIPEPSSSSAAFGAGGNCDMRPGVRTGGIPEGSGIQ